MIPDASTPTAFFCAILALSFAAGFGGSFGIWAGVKFACFCFGPWNINKVVRHHGDER